MPFIINALSFISYLLTLYTYVILAAVILSLLINFGVVNLYNPFVRNLNHALEAVTEPVFRRIRRYLPNTGGIDLSPFVAVLGIVFLQLVVIRSLIETLAG
ncbi:MAG: YggT family protein [Pseudomonadota bacterium]